MNIILLLSFNILFHSIIFAKNKKTEPESINSSEKIKLDKGENARIDTLYYFFEPINVYSVNDKNNGPLSTNMLNHSDISLGKSDLTINRTLQFVPGLLVMNDNNFAQDTRISIRGVGNRSSFGIRGIKILIDGVPESTADGQTQLDNIDLSYINKLQVFRGSNSALFGNSSGGAINFITMNNSEKDIINISSSYGSYQMSKHTLTIKKDFKRLSSKINFLNQKQTGYRNHSSTESNIVNANISYISKKNDDLQLSYNYVNSPISNDPGSLTFDQLNSDRTLARDNNILYDAGESVSQQKTTIKYNKILNENYLVKNYIFFLNRLFKNKLPFKSGGQVHFNRNYYGFGLSILKTTRYQAIQNKLIAGLEVLNQKDERKRYDNLESLKGPLSYDAQEFYKSQSIFIHNTILLKSNVNLVLSIRFDRNYIKLINLMNQVSNSDYDKYFDNVSPFFGLSFDLSQNSKYYFNLTQHFETPTLYELGNNPYNNGESFNTGLDPQVSSSIELGFTLKKDQNLDLDFSIYHTKTSNELIPFEIEYQPGRTFYRNAGTTKKFGAEFYLQYNFSQKYRLRLSQSYMDFIYGDYAMDDQNLDGNFLPLAPKNKSFLELQLLNIYKTRWMVRVVRISDFYADDMNETKVDGHLVTDLGLYKKLQFKEITCDLNIYFYNVFNTLYSSNIRVNAFGGRFYEPANEASITTSLTFSF